MKKKILYIIFGGLFLIAGTLIVISSILKNTILLTTGGILAGVFIILLVLFVTKLSTSTKSYFKKFNYYYDNLYYEDGLSYFTKAYKKVDNEQLKTQVSYYLLTFNLLLDKLDEARKLIKNTSWGNYEGYVLYFEILFDLLDGNLDIAYKKNETFQTYPQKNLSDRKNIMKNIIAYIKDEIDTITIDSPYPIVLNVINKYTE